MSAFMNQLVPEGLFQKQDPKDALLSWRVGCTALQSLVNCLIYFRNKIPRMHCFAEPGKLPISYVMCTQDQKQIGQAGPIWSCVVLVSAMLWNQLVVVQL